MEFNIIAAFAAFAHELKMPSASQIKRIARIIVRGAGLALGIFSCLAEYFFWAVLGRLTKQRRILILHRWSKFTLRGMGISIAVTGMPIPSGLIASNHLSYLDIMVYSAIVPCAFISKREVRAWPAIGWIATMAGTIYVDRSRRSETHAVQPEIQFALAEGLRLVLFPEGTSSDGSSVLHFHSSLFQPAVDLQAPVTAASIAYEVRDGIAGSEACYWGDMTLLPHLMNLLGKHSVMVTVKFSQQEFRFSERKQAARQMQNEVERLRGASVEAIQ